MTESTQQSARMRLAKPLITLLCVALVATVLWQLLPKAAFSSDLTRLGQGRPALVLLREVQSMGGERIVQQMQTLHPAFEQHMEFLVVHTGNPSGMTFAATHQLGDGGMVLFDAQGQVLRQIRPTESAAELRAEISEALSTSDQPAVNQPIPGR